ncbi:DNA-binding winged helix-turn-helix (wHTH) protein [Flavobacterium arsenatis]|uniref:DNA-binding winged helix-turn-helix (WHTH) protein n=1 Tax=Flavobacterium arsenatis TaxID=1484332 RepID=A0ABU1TTP0_9FLAO|nr:winged helix-turn-helix domain-containing protein [Flavobacterium arsenatis]MDR6969241.1 DNA-binding winged helix-turn-helix (wHTH) protein [Flavobacterium arsenatis]
MKQQKIYFYSSLCIAILSAIILLAFQNKNEVYTALTTIALRDAGNKLLLTNQDSTSLILPVQKLEESKYRLSFQKEIVINPDSLVVIVERSFQKANLPSHYQIEVKQCQDFEVAYSYQKDKTEEKSIIPCSGRFLPEKCYLIEVRFLEKALASSTKPIWIIVLIVSISMAFVFFPKPKKEKQIISTNGNSIPVGKFKFYPDENKLTVESTEILLSKKEVELLTVFVENPNKVIKREELSKKVWEDHGVFVGRSLDTYISKLRKKLSDDASIKLTNVHGIGYMLEVKNN